MLGMIDQIRAAAPQDPPGNFLVERYQFATLQEPAEGNKRGAGRPSWSAEHELDQPPDLLPGRYLIRYLKVVDGRSMETSRTEIDLIVQRAAPPRQPATPLPALPPPAAPPAPPQPADLVTRAIDGALQLAGAGEIMQTGAHQELRNNTGDLQRQLQEERTRNGALQDRIDRLIDDKLQLAELVAGRLPEIGRLLASAPTPPGEAPYVAVIREIWGGVGKLAESLAPGLNAKMGVPPEALRLAAKDQGALAQVQDQVRALCVVEGLPEPAQAPLRELRRLVGLDVPAAPAQAAPSLPAAMAGAIQSAAQVAA